MLMDDLLQGSTGDEFHPDADAIVVPIGTIDGDDVGMTQLCQHPAFSDERRTQLAPFLGPAEQFEGHFSIEARIPGSIDRAERTFADLLPNLERTPRCGLGACRLTDDRQV